MSPAGSARLPGLTVINPRSLGPPSGYANGVLAPAGARLLFVAGQIAWRFDEASGRQRIVGEGFADQFDQALANVLAVVEEAGGDASSIARLTIFVADKDEYVAALAEVGERYRRRMGRHYPAMALVEVSALLEEGAKVEIEATAVLSPSAAPAMGDEEE